MAAHSVTRAATALVALAALTCAPACALSSARGPASLHGPPVAKSFGSTVEASDPALARALTAVALLPSPAAHRAVAREYRRLRIDDVAFDHLKAATRLDPTDAGAYDELARIWRDWGFPHLGLPDSTRAVYYAPRSAAAHNTYGTLLAATGQPDAARREFEAALALDPTAVFAVENLCRLDRLSGTARAEDRCLEPATSKTAR
jgi:tetratricopeptide (TPR) repeat protein